VVMMMIPSVEVLHGDLEDSSIKAPVLVQI
jgi:hypothetical protein